MATPTPTPKGGSNIIEDLIGGTQNLISGATGAVGFWSDPFGSMYQAARDAIAGLTQDFLPALTGATLPDVTNAAFIETYKVSFALSIFVAVLLLVVQLIRTGKGTQSGRDTIHAIGLYFPGFILGVMFGPLAGILIINFVKALSDSLLAWAYQGTAEQLAADLVGVLQTDPAMFAGGVYIAWMIAWAMAIGLLFVVVLFVVQLVTLYFSGALIPLATVWIIDPSRRSVGLRAVSVWVGILLTHPLMFLLLGLAFRLIGSTITAWGSDGWKNLISLLVALIAMWAAALSPFFLLKYVRSISEGGGSSGGSAAKSIPTIGQPNPARHMQNAPTRVATAEPSTTATQAVRGSSAPAGTTLGQAAAARSGSTSTTAVGGRLVTAGAGGAARAGMVKGVAVVGGAPGAAAAVANGALRKGVQGANEAADTSVTAPPRESYGRDRP